MDSAQTLDRTGIDNRRPYLDQMTLPVATLRAGMTWNILPEKYNYSINGMMRGKPVPEEADVTLLHYRSRIILAEAGLKDLPEQFMADQIGTSRVRWVFKVPPPAGVALVGPEGFLPDLPPEPVEAPAHAPPPVFGPDPSKARMAAVTMVPPEMTGADHAALARWMAYYGGLIGRENLFILRQGHDAEVDRIAAGANVLHQPAIDKVDAPEDRRWSTLSHFTSGLTLYYNWVLCAEVDEIVAPSGAVALPDYLDALFATGQAPMTVAAVPVDVILQDGAQAVRPASGLGRPCITRKRVALSQGGPLREPLADLFRFRQADLVGPAGAGARDMDLRAAILRLTGAGGDG